MICSWIKHHLPNWATAPRTFAVLDPAKVRYPVSDNKTKGIVNEVIPEAFDQSTAPHFKIPEVFDQSTAPPRTIKGNVIFVYNYPKRQSNRFVYYFGHCPTYLLISSTAQLISSTAQLTSSTAQLISSTAHPHFL